MKTNKPTRKEIVEALRVLTRWATGTNKDGESKTGNPYCKAAVRQACRTLALEDTGVASWAAWDSKITI